MPIGNFSRYNGSPNIQPYQKKVSTTFELGDAMAIDSNGFLIPAIETTAADDIIGVSMRTVLATDADYAVATDVPVDLARKGDNGDWFSAKVGAGTPAQTMVGELHDLLAAGTVDLDSTTTKVVKVERIISSTEVIVSFVDGDAT